MTTSGPSIAALDRLLAPVSSQVFLTRYWERQPLHVARSRPPWCKELPRVDDIDEILTRSTGGDIRIVRTEAGIGGEAEAARNGDGRLDMAAAYRAYQEGWTIVINAVHAKLPSVSRLAVGLAETVSHNVGVNLYFTPPGSQGFAPHADGHDVFVLQLAGAKHWRIFQPSVPLPLEEQEVRVDRNRLGARLIDAVLKPGHVLYMPRGFIHQGRAGDAASVHLTIGIHPVRWIDLVKEAVAVAAERDVALRESVPLQDLSGARCLVELKNRLGRLSTALADPEIARLARERTCRQVVRASKPAADGHFAAIDRARSLGLGSVVQRRQGLICQVRRQGRRAAVEFGGNRVDGPAGIESALRFISAAHRFRVKDLPDDLTNDSKLLLARRLVIEGLLTVRK